MQVNHSKEIGASIGVQDPIITRAKEDRKCDTSRRKKKLLKCENCRYVYSFL